MTPEELLEKYGITSKDFFALTYEKAEIAYKLFCTVMEVYGTYKEKELLQRMRDDINKTTSLNLAELDTKS